MVNHRQDKVYGNLYYTFFIKAKCLFLVEEKKDKNLKDLILVGSLLVNLIDYINFLSPSQGRHVNSIFPCTVRL